MIDAAIDLRIARPPLPADMLADRVLVILRGDYDPEVAVRVGETLLEADIRSIEVTVNGPRVHGCIAALAAIPGLQVGAGTVLDPHSAERVLAAGGAIAVAAASWLLPQRSSALSLETLARRARSLRAATESVRMTGVSA